MLAAATFALSKLIVHEKAESWLREPFVDEDDARRPKGRRLRYAVGELLTCTRCTGAWTALALTALRLHAPSTGRTVATVLAASAGNDMLHAGFSWLCAGANTRRHEAEAGGRALSQPPDGLVDVGRVLEQLGRAREVEQPAHRRRDAREHEPHVALGQLARGPAAAP